MRIDRQLILKVVRAVSVIPIIYYYVVAIHSTPTPYISFSLSSLTSPYVLTDLAIIALEVIGLGTAFYAMVGSVVSLATSYSIYVILIVARSTYVSLGITYAVMAGLVVYIIIDVLARTWRGGAVTSLRVRIPSIATYLGFELFKFGVPILLAWFTFAFYEGILSTSITTSPGVSMLWDLMVSTLVGRLLIFLLVLGIGAYLIGSFMEVLAEYSMPSYLRFLDFLRYEVSRILNSLEVGIESKTVIRFMSFLGSLILYPFVIVLTQDFMSYLSKVSPVIASLITAPSFLPHVASNYLGFIQGIIGLVIAYLLMRYVFMRIVMLRVGIKGLVTTAVITALICTYLQYRYGLFTSLLYGGTQTPLDTRVWNAYYSIYSQALSLIRYVLYVLGVTP